MLIRKRKRRRKYFILRASERVYNRLFKNSGISDFVNLFRLDE